MEFQEKLKNLKLVVFDLDGTLLNNEGEISGETKDLIQQLRTEFNVRFTFASGRLHKALVDYAEELDLKTPIISLDGSMIKSHIDGKISYASYVPLRYTKKAVRLAENTLSKFALCHADKIYYTEDNSLIPELLEKYGAEYEMVESLEPYFNETLEIVVTGDIKENIRMIEKKMTFPSSLGLRTSYYKSHLYGGLYYLEVRKHGSSKGDGLKRICKLYKIPVSSSAVVGDWYNDRSLFETKALKVAVANAVPEITRLADIVTKKDNNEGGVAEFLQKIIDAKRK